MTAIAHIRAAVRSGRYEITEHALEETEADGFGPLDVHNALVEGELERRYTRDPRGIRYQIVGPALDGRIMYIVCRFNELKDVRVITVFAEAEHDEAQ